MFTADLPYLSLKETEQNVKGMSCTENIVNVIVSHDLIKLTNDSVISQQTLYLAAFSGIHVNDFYAFFQWIIWLILILTVYAHNKNLIVLIPAESICQIGYGSFRTRS